MENVEYSRTDENESDANLSWLEPGRRYICRKPLPGLHSGRTYQFEGFSADPLGDTRQYLFRDLTAGDFHGVELAPPMPTPIWREHLVADGE